MTGHQVSRSRLALWLIFKALTRADAAMLRRTQGPPPHFIAPHSKGVAVLTAHEQAGQGLPAGWDTWDRRHPPYEPGNTVAQVHGAYSPRKVDPLAAELLEAVLADPATAYLQASRWRPALLAWAKAEAQAQLLSEYLARRGEESGDGVGDLADPRVLSAYALLHRAESRAESGRSQLGLTPLSAARLGRDKAATGVDMARLMAELAKRDAEGPSGD